MLRTFGVGLLCLGPLMLVCYAYDPWCWLVIFRVFDVGLLCLGPLVLVCYA
jgi:hypothetical protein